MPTEIKDPDLARKTVVKPKAERPRLHKVILLNDHYTPREFVVRVLSAVFRVGGSGAYRIMMVAHTRGSCVVSVYPADVAETKCNEANALAKDAGHPLQFTTEPEE